MKVTIEFELDSSWDEYKYVCDGLLLDDLVETVYSRGVKDGILSVKLIERIPEFEQKYNY